MTEKEKMNVGVLEGDGLTPFIDNCKTGTKGILNNNDTNDINNNNYYYLTIVLCGVGTKSIIDILSKMKYLNPEHVKVERIITSPANTKPLNVRELYRCLAKLGFKINGISVDVERGRYYIGTRFDKKKEKLDDVSLDSLEGDEKLENNNIDDNDHDKCGDISFFVGLCNKLGLDKYTREKVVEWEDHHRRWELLDKRYK